MTGSTFNPAWVTTTGFLIQPKDDKHYGIVQNESTLFSVGKCCKMWRVPNWSFTDQWHCPECKTSFPNQPDARSLANGIYLTLNKAANPLAMWELELMVRNWAASWLTIDVKDITVNIEL